MDYNVGLHHKPGKAMVSANALSRRHDHHNGIEENEERIALPDGLFIRLLDVELQDTVAKGQLTNNSALEAIKHLTNPENQPNKWRLEDGADSQKCLFYNDKMYVPDNIAL